MISAPVLIHKWFRDGSGWSADWAFGTELTPEALRLCVLELGDELSGAEGWIAPRIVSLNPPLVVFGARQNDLRPNRKGATPMVRLVVLGGFPDGPTARELETGLEGIDTDNPGGPNESLVLRIEGRVNPLPPVASSSQERKAGGRFSKRLCFVFALLASGCFVLGYGLASYVEHAGRYPRKDRQASDPALVSDESGPVHSNVDRKAEEPWLALVHELDQTLSRSEGQETEMHEKSYEKTREHLLRLAGNLESSARVTRLINQALQKGSLVDRIEWLETQMRGCDVRLIPSINGVSGMPRKGENLIVISAVRNTLHFRIFDSDGEWVDTSEQSLGDKNDRIRDLKAQLESVWARHRLSGNEKDRLITAVSSIVGHTQVKEASSRSLVDGKEILERILAEWYYQLCNELFKYFKQTIGTRGVARQQPPSVRDELELLEGYTAEGGSGSRLRALKGYVDDLKAAERTQYIDWPPPYSKAFTHEAPSVRHGVPTQQSR